ncbi:Reverse transcriptase domain-containing protein [Aphis craccivora]|uniref:Reverse transcriptase domain-containing protein n=1 Tax=Aphis craccivora TaxID=307492 RepID=A0A6G0YZQ3_APHCR|nr:Reverse transcriptase domain-containing protein [Aphis craccivora]
MIHEVISIYFFSDNAKLSLFSNLKIKDLFKCTYDLFLYPIPLKILYCCLVCSNLNFLYFISFKCNIHRPLRGQYNIVLNVLNISLLSDRRILLLSKFLQKLNYPITFPPWIRHWVAGRMTDFLMNFYHTYYHKNVDHTLRNNNTSHTRVLPFLRARACVCVYVCVYDDHCDCTTSIKYSENKNERIAHKN